MVQLGNILRGSSGFPLSEKATVFFRMISDRKIWQHLPAGGTFKFLSCNISLHHIFVVFFQKNTEKIH